MGRQSGRLRAQIELACTDPQHGAGIRAASPCSRHAILQHSCPTLAFSAMSPSPRRPDRPARRPGPSRIARAAPARWRSHRPVRRQGRRVSGRAGNGRQDGIRPVGPFNPREAEPAGRITLVQGLPSGDKMDWVIEKPWSWARSASSRWRPSAACCNPAPAGGGPLATHRPIGQRAMRPQSPHERGRAANAGAMAGAAAEGLRLLCHPDADDDLAGALATLRNQDGTPALTLLVGPEGGWSDKELDQARAAGVQSVRFGPGAAHETAGLALIAAAAACSAGDTGPARRAGKDRRRHRRPGAAFLQSYSLSP